MPLAGTCSRAFVPQPRSPAPAKWQPQHTATSYLRLALLGVGGIQLLPLPRVHRLLLRDLAGVCGLPLFGSRGRGSTLGGALSAQHAAHAALLLKLRRPLLKLLPEPPALCAGAVRILHGCQTLLLLCCQSLLGSVQRSLRSLLLSPQRRALSLLIAELLLCQLVLCLLQG